LLTPVEKSNYFSKSLILFLFVSLQEQPAEIECSIAGMF